MATLQACMDTLALVMAFALRWPLRSCCFWAHLNVCELQLTVAPLRRITQNPKASIDQVGSFDGIIESFGIFITGQPDLVCRALDFVKH